MDYEIDVEDLSSLFINTLVYYALIKHIHLVVDEKSPLIPGADRTLESYED